MWSIKYWTESLTGVSKNTLALNHFLQLDPSDVKVYPGPPYPLGIDPVQTHSFLTIIRLVLLNRHKQCNDWSLLSTITNKYELQLWAYFWNVIHVNCIENTFFWSLWIRILSFRMNLDSLLISIYTEQVYTSLSLFFKISQDVSSTVICLVFL